MMDWISARRRTITPLAAYVSGSTAFLYHNDDALLSMPSVDFTVMAWVKPDQVGVAQVVLGKASAATIAGVEYDLQINAAGQAFAVVSDGTNVYIPTGSGLGTITAGVWNLLGLGVDDSSNPLVAGTAYVYKNGSSQTVSLTAGKHVQDGTGPFTLGGVMGAMTYGGGIDAVGIWRGRTLSDAENNQLYNLGNGYRYGTLPDSLRTNLTAWYELDDQSGASTWVDRLSTLSLSASGNVLSIPGKT